MDAVILAAGRGSRLGDLTSDRPKCLVDLGGITPLELQLDLLMARDIERVVLVTGYMGDLVATRAAERIGGRAALVRVWNPFWSRTNVLGSVWTARQHLDRPFVYLHADTVFEPGILDDLLAAPGDSTLPVDFRDCEPEEMKAEVVDGLIRYLSKALPADRTAGEFIGIAAFREGSLGRIRTGIDEVLAAGDLDAYFEAAINHAIQDGLAVMPLPTAGRAWREIDFPEDLAAARAALPRLLPGSA